MPACVLRWPKRMWIWMTHVQRNGQKNKSHKDKRHTSLMTTLQRFWKSLINTDMVIKICSTAKNCGFYCPLLFLPCCPWTQLKAQCGGFDICLCFSCDCRFQCHGLLLALPSSLYDPEWNHRFIFYTLHCRTRTYRDKWKEMKCAQIYVSCVCTCHRNKQGEGEKQRDVKQLKERKKRESESTKEKERARVVSIFWPRHSW